MAVRQRRPSRRPMSGRLLAAGLLILLALFTTALAAGSRNIGYALLAFIFTAGGVALLTRERIRARLRRTGPPPRNNPSPVEEIIAEVRGTGGDDEDEEGPDEAELASIDDLEASLRSENEAAEAAQAARSAPVSAPAPAPPADPEPEPEPAPAPPAQAVPKQRQPAWDPKPAKKNAPYTAVGHVENIGDPFDTDRAYVGESSLPAASVRDVAATLVVTDLARSVEFYTGLLGLVELDRSADAVLLEAGFGRVLLVSRPDAPDRPSPLMHLALEVSDVDSAYLHLQDRGVEFSHAPRAAITGGTYEVIAASFTDPDGHGLAITEIREI